MKSLIAVASFIFLTAATQVCGCGSCKVNAQSPTQVSFAVSKVEPTNAAYNLLKEEPKTVTIKITGMTCAGCASHVHTALSKTAGVISDEVKYPGDIAIVKYDASKVTVEQIIKAIEKTGYKAEIQKAGKSMASATANCEKDSKSCCAKS